MDTRPLLSVKFTVLEDLTRYSKSVRCLCRFDDDDELTVRGWIPKMKWTAGVLRNSVLCDEFGQDEGKQKNCGMYSKSMIAKYALQDFIIGATFKEDKWKCMKESLEQEERCFGDLWECQKQHITDKQDKLWTMPIIRVTTQQPLSYKQDSFTVQDSSISKQARLLPPRPRTTFSADLIKNRMSGRCGKGGNVVYMDGPDDPPVHGEGPPRHNCRSSSLKKRATMSLKCLFCYCTQ
ncbi:unnamed protein product [Mytilus edulis]|uniref:Uncharacterized protein n=1 Tax=Mytilus edulis TaxID=6550 RepID=A0A8S3QKS7_MYTED|nr:unnamed protein product [Mytilus edulis]